MNAVLQERRPLVPVAIPDDAVHEGGFAYWIEKVASDYHIMCAGAGNHFEVQRESSWYPDEIYEREQKMLAESKQKA